MRAADLVDEPVEDFGALLVLHDAVVLSDDAQVLGFAGDDVASHRRGWAKLRSRSTAEAIIGGITGTLIDPDALLLGRLDDTGRLRYVGRSHPLTAGQRRQLAGQLNRAVPRRTEGIDHPWPQPLPTTWSGRSHRSSLGRSGDLPVPGKGVATL